jgi:hypothetical protein
VAFRRERFRQARLKKTAQTETLRRAFGQRQTAVRADLSVRHT